MIRIHSRSQYDHFTFPGAVPRTFIGSVALAWISTPVIQFASWLGLVSTKFDLQIIGSSYPCRRDSKSQFIYQSALSWLLSMHLDYVSSDALSPAALGVQQASSLHS